MLRSVRYQNPKVRDHLASQYAMGLLLPAVKRRVEKLMQQDPTFEREVIAWQERLAPLNELPTEVAAPAYVKEKVMAQIQGKSASGNKTIASWWQSLWFWQGIAMASMALFIVLAVQPFGTNVPEIPKLSYVAVMQTALASGEAPLVISAYGKTEKTPSRLELRWNDRTDRQSVDQATLWAIERDTGNVTQLTTLAAGATRIDLDGSQWQAVKNSLELVVVKGNDFNGEVLMRGICIQLADWNQA